MVRALPCGDRMRVLVVLLAAVLAGNARAADTVRVTIPVFSEIDDAPFYLGADEGYYAEEGLACRTGRRGRRRRDAGAHLGRRAVQRLALGRDRRHPRRRAAQDRLCPARPSA